MDDHLQEKPPSPWSSEGQPVPDEQLIIGLIIVLAKHSGRLTTRRADVTTRETIARDLVAQLRRSGYRITFGPGAAGHSTPYSLADKP
ncbi:hypothetical protein ABMY26_00405 (plasmid) [Azospirillum sp. HJ39]|uniref:hypothetical protein n=1 Tax=Azospirillum sp. HJ39 TaxID=3159496 RepID=UPI0035581D94